jgi:hypothetical protein
VRRLAGWPLLLVLSWQPEQAGRLRGLRTALGEAEGQLAGQTIEPGPLGAEAIGALLDLDGMPRVDVARLLEQTRGLPMLVREYVEALRSAGPTPEAPETSETSKPGALGSAGADWWPPASVRDLLRTRLQAVSEPTLQMLTAAAVLGSAEPLMNRRVWPGGGCCPVGPPTSSSAGTSVIRPVPGPRPWPAICSWPALAPAADDGPCGGPPMTTAAIAPAAMTDVAALATTAFEWCIGACGCCIARCHADAPGARTGLGKPEDPNRPARSAALNRPAIPAGVRLAMLLSS